MLEGAVRNGCTHLIIDLLLSDEERQRLLACGASLAEAVHSLGRPSVWHDLPSSPPCVVSTSHCRHNL